MSSVSNPVVEKYLSLDRVLEKGRVFCQNGTLYFSPNSKLPITIPTFQEPIDRTPSDLIRYDLEDYLPVNWYTGLHHAYSPFIPVDLPYTFPFDPLSLKRMPTRVDIAVAGNQVPDNVQRDFKTLEIHLVGMVDLISRNLPEKYRLDLPSHPHQRGGYMKPGFVKGLRGAANAAYRSRDWFLCWIGAFIYCATNFQFMWGRKDPSTVSNEWVRFVRHYDPQFEPFASVAHVWLTHNLHSLKFRGLVIRVQDLPHSSLNPAAILGLDVPIWVPVDSASYEFCQANPAFRVWFPPQELVNIAVVVDPQPFRVPARARHPHQTRPEYIAEALDHEPGQTMSQYFHSEAPLVTPLSEDTIPPSTARFFLWRYSGWTGLLIRERVYQEQRKHSLVRQVQWRQLHMYYDTQGGVVDFYQDWGAPRYKSFSTPHPSTTDPAIPLLPPLRFTLDIPPPAPMDIASKDMPGPSCTPVESTASLPPWRQTQPSDPTLPDELDYAEQLAIVEAMDIPSPSQPPSLEFKEWTTDDVLHVARYRYGFTSDPPLHHPNVTIPPSEQWVEVLGHLQFPTSTSPPPCPFHVLPILPALFTYLQALTEFRHPGGRDTPFPHPQLCDLFPTSPQYLPRHPRFPAVRRIPGAVDHLVIGRSESRDWDLVVRHGVDALHACRLLIDGKSIDDIVLEFVTHGIEFNTVATATRAISTHDGPSLPIRPKGLKYDGRDVTHFHGLRAGLAESLGIVRAAYMAGGLLWRSIRDAHEAPTADLFLNGPIYDQGGENGYISGDLWDNRLSFGEQALLLGGNIEVQPLPWNPTEGTNTARLPNSRRLESGRSVHDQISSANISYTIDENDRLKLTHDLGQRFQEDIAYWIIPFTSRNIVRAGYMGFWSMATEARYRKRVADMDVLSGYQNTLDSDHFHLPTPALPSTIAGKTIQPLANRVWHRRVTFCKTNRNLMDYMDAVALDLLSLPIN